MRQPYQRNRKIRSVAASIAILFLIGGVLTALIATHNEEIRNHYVYTRRMEHP